MNIGIVINTSWNIFNFRQGLIQALQLNGHNVFAIAPEDAYSSKLEQLGVKFVPIKIDSKKTNPIKDFKLILDFRKIYIANKLDFVLQYTIKPNIYGTMATYLTKTRAINNVSGLGTTFIRENLLSLLVQKMYTVSFKKAFHVFFQNSDDLNLFLDKKMVQFSKTGIVPGSGIPLEKIRYKQKLKSENFTFLMPSRLLIDKGLGEFLESAERIKKEYKGAVSFILCGKPEENPKLGYSLESIKVWEQKKVIQYLGHVDDVLDLIEKCDVVVLPSYREGTPRALLEACAIGRPVLTTNAPGCKEVIEDGVNGFLCEVKSSNSLYICMKRFLELSQIEKESMGLASRKLVETKFDERLVIKAYIDKINQN